jgi:thioredoxin reductase (NADPH)
VGNRWSPASHQVKDFLSRNQVPYQWLDIEAAEAQELATYSLATTCPGQDIPADALPLVVFADGSQLRQPTNTAIAEKIGLRTQAARPFYDLAIVGGGPAGLAAAVYGASEGLSTVLIEREAPGGQAGSSSRIENYLGFPVGLSGADLARRAVTQAKRFGVEILTPQEVASVKLQDSYRILQLKDGSELSCHALLIATGVSYRRLQLPGADQLTGAGIYYGAAMTEALACSGEDVYLVGGANSAGQAAMHFAKYAARVIMLVRAESLALSMSQYLIDQIAATPNIEVRTHCQVTAVQGLEHLETITIGHKDGHSETVPAKSLFIFIGASPQTDWLTDLVVRDAQGFICTGAELLQATGNGSPYPKGWPLERPPFLLESSVPGIFAAGDVRSGSVKRVASGVGEGSIAVQFIHRHLANL